MGENGRQSVKNRTIQVVVADLLEWYQLGLQRRKARFFFSTLIGITILTGTVCFGIFAFFWDIKNGVYNAVIRHIFTSDAFTDTDVTSSFCVDT